MGQLGTALLAGATSANSTCTKHRHTSGVADRGQQLCHHHTSLPDAASRSTSISINSLRCALPAPLPTTSQFRPRLAVVLGISYATPIRHYSSSQPIPSPKLQNKVYQPKSQISHKPTRTTPSHSFTHDSNHPAYSPFGPVAAPSSLGVCCSGSSLGLANGLVTPAILPLMLSGRPRLKGPLRTLAPSPCLARMLFLSLVMAGATPVDE